MELKGRICICCGTRYKYCPNCNGYNPDETWKMAFHDWNCRQIYNATLKYKGGSASKAEAKSLLDECDLSVINSDTFNRTVLRDVNEIIAEDEPVVTEVSEDTASVKVRKRKTVKKETETEE